MCTDLSPSTDLGESSDTESTFDIQIHLHGQALTLPFPDDSATIQDLSELVATDLDIPSSNQKFLISPKVGLLKPPFKNPALRLAELRDKKIVLIGATITELQNLESELTSLKEKIEKRRAAQAAGRKVQAYKSRDSKRITEEARYTFQRIAPLAHLPYPERSQRFLERLAADPGIKRSMRTHQFSVGLLTEMDPAEHTTHESRTLGLNKNRGEEILLRLRTDAADGYRDYKTIRRTLCHELAHNVHSDHDRLFWDLCGKIEKEVEANDWTRGGRSLSAEEFYAAGDAAEDEAEEEEPGWRGGAQRLGGKSSSLAGSMRETLARAAEERLKRQKGEERPQGSDESTT